MVPYNSPEDYEAITSLACQRVHLVSPTTVRVFGALRTNRCARFYVFTHRALRSYGAVSPLAALKSGGGGRKS